MLADRYDHGFLTRELNCFSGLSPEYRARQGRNVRDRAVRWFRFVLSDNAEGLLAAIPPSDRDLASKRNVIARCYWVDNLRTRQPRTPISELANIRCGSMD